MIPPELSCSAEFGVTSEAPVLPRLKQTLSMQQAGRLRLRPWLEEQIQSGRYPGVSWLDQVGPKPPTQYHGTAGFTQTQRLGKVLLNSMERPHCRLSAALLLVLQSARIFQIPWKHAARHGWSIDQDATLFRSWAIHTGKVISPSS